MSSFKTSVDLKKELLIQVAGEEEKNHTLSWELLKKIGDNTQNLINALVKSSTDQNMSTEYTKLVFAGFFSGSAIPAWRLDPPTDLIFPIKKGINTLNRDFNSILKSLNSGNFQQIADRYHEPSVKNEVVEAVYEFSNSVGTKPLMIVTRSSPSSLEFNTLAKIRKMSVKQKDLLRVKMDEPLAQYTSEQTEVVGKFLLSKTPTGKTSKKNLRFYTQKEADLSLHFDSIETDKRIYYLKDEVPFKIMNDDKKSFIVENRLLDIFASGENKEEAKQDLFDQFDFTYQRLTEIEDNKLSKHLLDAKRLITLIVDRIKEK